MAQAQVQRAAVLSRPKYYERLLFVGANGSGKSELALELLQCFESWVIVDSKGDAEPHGTQTYTVIKSPNDIRWKWAKRILYRPSPEYNNGAWLEEIVRRMYVRAQKGLKKVRGQRKKVQTKPFILYIDEGLLFSKLAKPKWLAAHAVAGRSLQCGLWVASQRPKWIPVEVRTEAWRTYIFWLKRMEDKKEIANDSGGLITVDDLNEAVGDYSFYEIKRIKGGREIVTHFPPVQLTH